MDKRIFIVIQILDESISLFEIAGVFTTQKKAVEACRNDSFCYFISELDFEFPIETTFVECVCPTKRVIYKTDGTIIPY